MKKKLILTAIILIAVILILSVAFQITVRKINNNIATKVEEELLSMPLPEGAELVDSLSDCGRLIGKTTPNGMVYQAAILVRSDLSLGKLSDYYFENNKDYEISIVETSDADANLDILGIHNFENFKETNDKYYVVTYTGDRTDYTSEFWGNVLDLDTRAYGW